MPLVAAPALVVLALVLAAGDVHTEDGAICGSAWRASRGSLDFSGGDRTPASRLAVEAECTAAGERRMPWAYGAAGLAVVVAGAGYAVRRSHSP